MRAVAAAAVLICALGAPTAHAHKSSCPSRDLEVWENPLHGSIRFTESGTAIWTQAEQSTEYRIEPNAAAPPVQLALEDGRSPPAPPIRFSKQVYQWEGDMLLLIWDGIAFHLECRKAAS